jgi:enamine deaminase RidA (YjgF/YER057c/UK114 family)
MKNSEVLTADGFASMLADSDEAAATAIKANIEKTIEHLGEIGVGRVDALLMLEIFYKTGVRTDGLNYAMAKLAEESEAEVHEPEAKEERSMDSISQLESELIEALELAQQEIKQAVDNFKATAERASREIKDILDRHGKI